MKAALITGGARRIGAAIARALAEDGWHVCIHHNRSGDDARAVLDSIRAAGGDGRLVRADLADPDAARVVLAQCADVTLSCLVNNASLFDYDDLGAMTVESFDRHMAVNLRAPALLAQGFAAQAPERGGCIVNLVDNKVFSLNPDYLSYSLSKVGLAGLTEMLAMGLSPRVRVAAIAPGITLSSDRMTAEEYDRLHALNPLGRGCSVAEIVLAVRFILATPSFNGRAIVIDGGQSLLGLDRDVAFIQGGRA
ncbi:MAG: SDR family NAD(P)-dependent oxidoreductase [Alphaproteobacteria bacterium]|nr:SDR family NAD(P)-dependent oxidoreductase [Alphaproteobacteria bacterium]